MRETMKKLYVFAALPLFFLAACATTTGDPHQGGLFGWSSEKADQRIEERSTGLQGLQRQNQIEGESNRQLSQEAAAKQQELAGWQSKVRAVDKENASLKKRLNAYKAKNNNQKIALDKLRAKQAELQQQTAAIKSGGDVKAKEAEADDLRRQVDRLSKDFEALSRL
jgi:chromosome segregation ATPase